MPRLLIPERQVIPAQTKFNRIAQRCPADDLNTGAVAEAHLKESTAQFRVAANAYDAPFAADAQLIQRARLRRAVVIANTHVTGLVHP